MVFKATGTSVYTAARPPPGAHRAGGQADGGGRLNSPCALVPTPAVLRCVTQHVTATLGLCPRRPGARQG